MNGSQFSCHYIIQYDSKLEKQRENKGEKKGRVFGKHVFNGERSSFSIIVAVHQW